MIENDKEAQEERAAAQAAEEARERVLADDARRRAFGEAMPIREVGGGPISIVEALAKPTEIELIGEMATAMEQIPEAGRLAALRYLMDRYGPPSQRPPMY